MRQIDTARIRFLRARFICYKNKRLLNQICAIPTTLLISHFRPGNYPCVRRNQNDDAKYDAIPSENGEIMITDKAN